MFDLVVFQFLDTVVQDDIAGLFDDQEGVADVDAELTSVPLVAGQVLDNYCDDLLLALALVLQTDYQTMDNIDELTLTFVARIIQFLIDQFDEVQLEVGNYRRIDARDDFLHNPAELYVLPEQTQQVSHVVNDVFFRMDTT